MKNTISRAIHIFYAYIVACALGMLINGAMVLLAYTVFTSTESHKAIDSYGSYNGLLFVTVTLILGLVFLPFTIKLKLNNEKNT